MKRYLNILLLSVFIIVGCEDDNIVKHPFTEQQIAAKNLAGDWGAAFGIVAPDIESADALRGLNLLFTVDKEGNPDKFYSSGALSVFGNKVGGWKWANESTTTDVILTEVGPITSFTISYSDNIDTITLLFSATNSSGRVKAIGDYEISFRRL